MEWCIGRCHCQQADFYSGPLHLLCSYHQRPEKSWQGYPSEEGKNLLHIEEITDYMKLQRPLWNTKSCPKAFLLLQAKVATSTLEYQ